MTVNGLADALTELLDNEAFAETVTTDADAALGGYDLDADERAALVADAEALSAETSGFNIRGLVSLERVRVGMGSLQPINGAVLGGAVSRATAGCGEHGCCSWETALK